MNCSTSAVFEVATLLRNSLAFLYSAEFLPGLRVILLMAFEPALLDSLIAGEGSKPSSGRLATQSEIQTRHSSLRATSLCLIYWSVIESERLLAGIAFDQDSFHARGIIERPDCPQTGRSPVDGVQAIAEGLVGGWVWIPIGCLNPRPLRAIPSLRENELAGKTDGPDV